MRRTRWQLCPVNGCLRETRGPGMPGPYRQSKFAAKKFQKTPPVSQLGHNRVV